MGSCFSSNEPRIDIIDETPLGEKFWLFKAKGNSYSIDKTYNIPLIEIDFAGCFESSVHIWPENNKMKTNFILLERTSPLSPSISLFLLSLDSRFAYV